MIYTNSITTKHSVKCKQLQNKRLMLCVDDVRSVFPVLCTYCCLPCSICNIASRTGEYMCMPWFVPGGLIALRARIRTLGGIQVCRNS